MSEDKQSEASAPTDPEANDAAPGAGAAPPPEPQSEARPAAPDDPVGGGELPPDFDVLQEEARAVDAAADRPAAGGGRRARHGQGDRTELFPILFLALLFLFGWVGGTLLWQLRGELRQAQARLGAVERRFDDFDRRAARVALQRARAEVDSLGATLPASLQGELERIGGALRGLEEQLQGGAE